MKIYFDLCQKSKKKKKYFRDREREKIDSSQPNNLTREP